MIEVSSGISSSLQSLGRVAWSVRRLSRNRYRASSSRGLADRPPSLPGLFGSGGRSDDVRPTLQCERRADPFACCSNDAIGALPPAAKATSHRCVYHEANANVANSLPPRLKAIPRGLLISDRAVIDQTIEVRGPERLAQRTLLEPAAFAERDGVSVNHQR